MRTLQSLKDAYQPVPVPPAAPESVQWFRDAKFGMFIHWGLYALLERGEWVMFSERLPRDQYAKLADQFTATQYRPKEWARTAREAGMKYMVLTTRHHDGFSLFNTAASDYNSVKTGAGRDLVAEYVEACRAEGLKVGFYYSPMDWRFPGYFFPDLYLDDALAMKEQCWTQIRELMTNYGKIDMLWYDGEWLAHGGTRYDHGIGWYRDENYGQDELYFKVNYFWESEKLNAMVRELQPGILINNRSGWEGDFHVRERRIGEMRTDKPWDANDCISDSWGYRPGTKMLTTQECIQNLIRIVTRDGNYLLNLDPDGTGAIEERKINRLKEVGEWIRTYGHTLYGTRGGPFIAAEWGGATYRDNVIYLHVTQVEGDTLRLPAWNQQLVSAVCLTGESVQVEVRDDRMEIRLLNGEWNAIDTIVALTCDGPIVWDGIQGVEDDIYGLADGFHPEAE